MVRVARSLLGAQELPHELIVIDQSADSETERALAALGEPRLRYVRSQSLGKGAALNEGIRLAQGEIIVCTDDDCEATPEWVAGMVKALEDYPSAAVAFSNVVAPPYDRRAGYVPTYERDESRLLRSVIDLCRGHGLGAGMAIRRSAVLEFGGCDETMGPGSLFPSADDIDLAIRALLLGWHVRDTAEVAIVHHGFRSFAQGREHVKRDWLALGATCSKSLRAGRLEGAIPTLWQFATAAVLPPLSHMAHLRKPSGLTRITAFVQGFAQGILTPVDRRRLVFTPRE